MPANNKGDAFNMKFEEIHLTPDVAAHLLSRNRRNRKLSHDHVNKLAGAIRRGEWVMNGDSLKVDEMGNLVDGQHRCHAVVVADKGVHTTIIYGVPADSQLTMDQGRTRNLRDHLRMLKVPDAQNVAATVSMVAKIEQRWESQEQGLVGAHHSSDWTVQWLYERYSADADAYGRAAVHGRQIAAGLGWAPSAGAAVAYFAQDKHPDEWENFVASVATGVNLIEGDPVLALRNCAYNRRSVRGERVSTIFAFAAIAKAWNLFVADREATRITFHLHGSKRENVPTVL